LLPISLKRNEKDFNAHNMKIKIVLAFVFITSIVHYGCTKQGDVGQSSLLNLIPEPAGSNCPAGGVKVMSGVDANRNGVLEDNEIQNVKYVCNGSSDKQVIIYFPANGIAYSTTSASGYVDTVEVLRDFNILNYANADSINFSAYLQTSDSSVSSTVNLYDMTNNAPINNTTLTSNSTSSELRITAANFLHDLPQTPIKLGIQVKSGLEGSIVYYYLPMITIYRQ
jgi:hypothetical protein